MTPNKKPELRISKRSLILREIIAASPRLSLEHTRKIESKCFHLAFRMSILSYVHSYLRAFCTTSPPSVCTHTIKCDSANRMQKSMNYYSRLWTEACESRHCYCLTAFRRGPSVIPRVMPHKQAPTTFGCRHQRGERASRGHAGAIHFSGVLVRGHGRERRHHHR